MSAIGSNSTDQPRFTEHEKIEFQKKKKEKEELLNRMAGRNKVLHWCCCQKCILMNEDQECYCCQESAYINEIRVASEIQIECITQNHDFYNFVLNKKLLNIFRSEKVRKGDNRFRDNRSAVWRYIAYSMIVKWLRSETNFGDEALGLRYVIPSCIVNVIRET